jgi:ACT domain-containing protein
MAADRSSGDQAFGIRRLDQAAMGGLPMTKTARSVVRKESGGRQSAARMSGRAIVTVVGIDRIGIIAGIARVLAAADVNILDISQSVMRDFFTMIMMVDLARSSVPFDQLSARLAEKGKELSVEVRIQREDIFKAMHRL